MVKRRANYACEYCGVTEIETGGELTIDHFHPLSKGGTDDLSNLVYCCHRCNSHKSDYWPGTLDAPSLWNPRQEPSEAHFLTLDSGEYVPLSTVGAFTLNCLHLNRKALVEHRRIRIQSIRNDLRLASYEDLVKTIPRLQRELLSALEENTRLRRLMIMIIRKDRKDTNDEEA